MCSVKFSIVPLLRKGEELWGFFDRLAGDARTVVNRRSLRFCFAFFRSMSEMAISRQPDGGPPKLPQSEGGSLNFLKARLMHSRATVVIPLYNCVIFISALNGAELVSWFSEISQPLDAITGGQFSVGSRGLRERWALGAICVSSCSGM